MEIPDLWNLARKKRARAQIWFHAEMRDRCEEQLASWPSPRTRTTGHVGRSGEAQYRSPALEYKSTWFQRRADVVAVDRFLGK